MYTIVGIAIVLVVLFIYSVYTGVEVVGLGIVTLLLWHGIWRLIDHIEMVTGNEQKPLNSAVVSITLATALAFAFHKFHPQESMTYIKARF
jgi:hypothetical protein